MEIRNLKSFVSIVEEGSFLNAAKKLHYTQSTITSHIQQLEGELDIKVFEKIGRKMCLTSFGKKLLPYAKKLLNTSEEIKELSKDKNLMGGELKVAMGDSLVTYEFQDILKEFKKKAPSVKLSILTVDIISMRDMLENAKVDLGFLFKDNHKSHNLIDVPFKNFPLTLVASNDSEFLNVDFDTLTIDKNFDINFITNEFHSPYRNSFIDYLKEKNIILNSILEIWSIEGIKRSVKNNLGITYLPKFVMRDELISKDLIEIKSECSNKSTQGIYSYHKNKFITPPMKLFIDIVNNKYNI